MPQPCELEGAWYETPLATPCPGLHEGWHLLVSFTHLVSYDWVIYFDVRKDSKFSEPYIFPYVPASPLSLPSLMPLRILTLAFSLF